MQQCGSFLRGGFLALRYQEALFFGVLWLCSKHHCLQKLPKHSERRLCFLELPPTSDRPCPSSLGVVERATSSARNELRLNLRHSIGLSKTPTGGEGPQLSHVVLGHDWGSACRLTTTPRTGERERLCANSYSIPRIRAKPLIDNMAHKKIKCTSSKTICFSTHKILYNTNGAKLGYYAWTAKHTFLHPVYFIVLGVFFFFFLQEHFFFKKIGYQTRI